MALSQDRNEGMRRSWQARPALDPTLRRAIYGKIRPMDQPGILPGLLHRLLGRH
ncbi:hypothetical protein [Novosphingobium sp. Leaf2]|uniref:hypothetical protein n=1 Tax=Novosphingobium sp. Leaf2 TaxID=1735670 RepID=UPI000AC7B679|nr:hypothetical protein [Novosphingobium sp. Leaf2]